MNEVICGCGIMMVLSFEERFGEVDFKVADIKFNSAHHNGEVFIYPKSDKNTSTKMTK